MGNTLTKLLRPLAHSRCPGPSGRPPVHPSHCVSLVVGREHPAAPAPLSSPVCRLFNQGRRNSQSGFDIAPKRSYPIQLSQRSSLGVRRSVFRENPWKKPRLSPRNSKMFGPSSGTVRIPRPGHRWTLMCLPPAQADVPCRSVPSGHLLHPCLKEDELRSPGDSSKGLAIEEEDHTETREQEGQRTAPQSGEDIPSTSTPLETERMVPSFQCSSDPLKERSLGRCDPGAAGLPGPVSPRPLLPKGLHHQLDEGHQLSSPGSQPGKETSAENPAAISSSSTPPPPTPARCRCSKRKLVMPLPLPLPLLWGGGKLPPSQKLPRVTNPQDTDLEKKTKPKQDNTILEEDEIEGTTEGSVAEPLLSCSLSAAQNAGALTQATVTLPIPASSSTAVADSSDPHARSPTLSSPVPPPTPTSPDQTPVPTSLLAVPTQSLSPFRFNPLPRVPLPENSGPPPSLAVPTPLTSHLPTPPSPLTLFSNLTTLRISHPPLCA
ncbi:nuclear pore-associated protein 1-like [Tamandua tetradactyla]|uniref:nuclear pore-associated protein 1-like n=1 Tax=Tamandua tetradactyla TaxID=48850 RepID=UPI0040541D9B